MTSATVAYGLSLKKTGGTNIAEILSLDGPNAERDMIDVTNMQSASQAKEFIAGLIDGGEISLDLNYLPQNATHKLILTDLATPSTATGYTLTLTDASTSTITANLLVKSFKLKGAVADRLSASVTFKVTGPVTWPT